MRVLISAYACEPDRGSEPGVGWTWALAAARDHDVCVLTRANNRAPIEAALAALSGPQPTFVYVDLPRWARSWKRGGRGLRMYYALWQVAAAITARRLHRERQFDVVHHLTFANVWLPALACLVRAPFVLGPVGGGPRVPLRLYPTLGPRGVLHEVWLVAGRMLSRGNPLVRLGWRRAAVVLVQNEETRRALPGRLRAKAVLRPNPCVLPVARVRRVPEAPLAVVAGRLLPWKGVALALGAIQLLPEWRLVVVGQGPDRGRLERLARRWGVDRRVRFVPWLAQEELWDAIAASTALVVPSLREDASFVAAEAQSLGVPVVAFDRGGPAALARAPKSRFLLVPLRSRAEAARALAAALLAAPDGVAPPVDFGPARVAADLGEVYDSAGAAA